VQATDPRNGAPHATLLFAPGSPLNGTALQQQWFDVVVRGASGPCTGHLWLYIDYASYHDVLKGLAGTGHDVGNGAALAGYLLADGYSLFTTTIPATAVGVIAAGSFLAPKPAGSASSVWTGDDGVTYDQSDLSAPGGLGSVTGDLSSFSSLGPTADGRTKPDVVAPGEPIVAAKARGSYVASSVTVGGSHFKDAGTSMSSPHVAGIVALLLSRNNTLGVDGVRAALRAGAGTSGLVAKTADPENSYGAGKVDARSVLGAVAVDTSAYHGTGDIDGGGGGGCSLGRAERAAPIPAAALVVAALLAALLRRRRKAAAN
jgi:hypothetical protein